MDIGRDTLIISVRRRALDSTCGLRGETEVQNRRRRWLLIILLGLSLPFFPYEAHGQSRTHTQRPRQPIHSHEDNRVHVLHPMTVGCELPGVHLDLVTADVLGLPMEAWEHIRLSDGS